MLGYFLLLQERVAIPNHFFAVSIGSLCALVACLALFEITLRLRKSMPLPETIKELVSSYMNRAVRVVTVGRSDFSERSLLFSRTIGVPANHIQYKELNPQLYNARIAHELGHSKYRDCLFVLLYLFSSIVSLTIITAGFLSNEEPELSNPVPEYGSSFSGTAIGVSYSFILVVSLFRLFLLLRTREYRADSFAHKILGENYAQFLKHQERKSRFSKRKIWIYDLFSRLTHPTFSSRLIRLRSQSIHYGLVIGEAFQWALITAFITIIYFGVLFTSVSPQIASSDGSFTSTQYLLSTILVVLVIIGIHLLLVGVSQIQYAYLLESKGKNKAALFSIVLATSLALPMFVLMYSNTNDKVHLPTFGILYGWFACTLAFNVMVFNTQSHHGDLPTSRITWSWLAMIVFIFCLRPETRQYISWITTSALILGGIALQSSAYMLDQRFNPPTNRKTEQA